MKYSIILIITIFILIAEKVSSQTYISGGIFSDTTWSSQYNPYIINGDVVIFEDITLTIENGVEIRIKPNTKIDLRGSIIANGTIQDSIYISIDTIPSSNTYWDGIILGNSFSLQIDFNYIKAENADILFNCALASGNITITNCNFSNNNYVISGYNGVGITIDSSGFSNNNYAISDHNWTVVSNSTFINNMYGFYNAYTVNIDNCVFENNTEAGIMGNTSQGTIRNCNFNNNKNGLEYNIYNGSATENTYIENNYFGCNNIGFKIGSCTNNISHISSNTFEKNTEYDIYYTGANNCDLGNNCWNSTIEDSIRTTIYDAYTDINVGIIYLNPIDSNCHSYQCAMNTDIDIPQVNQEKILLYPNPINSKFSVVYENIEHVEIFNEFGQLILRTQEYCDIDLSSQSNGMYFIKVITDNQILTRKIIKQ